MAASRWRRFGLAILIALLVFYGGFELGRASSGYSIVSSLLDRLEMRRQVRSLDAENESLRHRVAAAEIGQRVDRQAQSEAQRMIRSEERRVGKECRL